MEGERHQRLRNDQNNQDLDRISELPDSILLHILSFLSTKVAVGTSVLSKRWLNLWIDLPVLDFDWSFRKMSDTGMKDYVEKKVSFKSFVNKVLLLNRASPITKCTLSHIDKFDCAHTTGWICALSTRQVKEIVLVGGIFNLVGLTSVEFPCKLFMLESLSVLRLNLLRIDFAPNAVQFRLPNLKILHLKVSYNSRLEISAFVNRLVAGCPVLEELSIRLSYYSRIEIRGLTLKTLYISSIEPAHPNSRQVILEAPNLKWLRLRSANLSYKGIHTPVLTRAHISSSCPSLEALSAISKTSTLYLSYYGGPCKLDCEKLPRFHNLTCLKLRICFDPKIGFILGMLNNCCQLQDFALNFDGDVHKRDWMPPHSVPQCLLSSLKVFQLHAYELFNSVDFLKYFLENGRVLEEINLSGCRKEDYDSLQKLLMPHMLSSACRVTYGEFDTCTYDDF